MRASRCPSAGSRASTVPRVDPFSLDGRTALVTGASRGIGEAIAIALDRAGARVAVTARTEAALAEVAAKLTNDPVVIGTDLSSAEGPAAVADQSLDAMGRVDVLVNNAAVGVRMDSTELTAEIIDDIHHLNVRGLLLLSTALLPSMVERGSGSIVNVSSVSGLVGTPRRAAYAASKGAVDAMTRSLAMEFGPSGIRVNAVAPGVVETAMWERNRSVPGVIEQIEAQTPLRRWGRPDDIADVVVFLASDAARSRHRSDDPGRRRHGGHPRSLRRSRLTARPQRAAAAPTASHRCRRSARPG